MDLQDRFISAGREMPTIFVTAYPDAKSERQALSGGAIAYLRKPIEESHLLEHIGTALSGVAYEGGVPPRTAEA